MAQQRCVACKKFIKNGSKTCPHCGTVQQDTKVETHTEPNSAEPTSSDDKDWASRADRFLAKTPLPILFFLFLVVAFLLFSLIFVIVGFIAAPSLVATDGPFSLFSEIYPLLLIFSALLALAPLPSISEQKRAMGLVKGESKVLEVFSKLVVVGILLLIIAFFYSCSSSCSGPGRSSSGVDYSERAQELGTSTKEYADAYNYWKYGNP